MKKLFFIFILMFFYTDIRAYESNVRVEYMSNVYFNYYVGSTLKSWKMGYIYVDDQIAYCIDMQKGITSNVYNRTEDFSSNGISNDLKKELEAISYYGYDESDYSYMATQEIIWNKFGENLFWTTGVNGTGNVIDVSTYKEAILNDVRKHEVLPSFKEDELKFNIGNASSIIDFNEVLSNYNLIYNGDNQIHIYDDTLAFNVSKAEKGSLSFTRRIEDRGKSYIYNKESGQRIIKMGTPKYENFVLDYEVKGGSLQVKTITEEPESNYNLKGIIYEIYYDDKLVGTMTTDINGEAYIYNLDAGIYTIKQKNTIPGFKENEAQYSIEVGFEDLHKNIEIENYILRRELRIKNYYISQTSYLPFEGVEFEIYKDDNLIDTLVTDDKGRTSIKLEYGIYIIKQKISKDEYEGVQEFEFVVDSDGTATEYSIFNKRIEKTSEENEENVDEETTDEVDLEKLPNLNNNKGSIGMYILCVGFASLIYLKLKQYYY